MEFASSPGLIIAALGGAVIGLEREWSGHAAGPDRRFGGIRTFTLLGGVAGLAGGLAGGGFVAVAVVLLCAAAALIVVGYLAASHRDVDATTEVAAVVVLASGTLAGAGEYAVASAVIAATALLLVEKTRLHRLVSRIDDVSLRASLRFAAMACIVLPLLPSGPYGPYDAVRPRELWALVLFFSGLAFLGWIARRLVGAHHGAIVAGLLGGIISSTSVTLRFAQDSRRHDAPRGALGPEPWRRSAADDGAFPGGALRHLCRAGALGGGGARGNVRVRGAHRPRCPNPLAGPEHGGLGRRAPGDHCARGRGTRQYLAQAGRGARRRARGVPGDDGGRAGCDGGQPRCVFLFGAAF